jgi:hypothetical protein
MDEPVEPAPPPFPAGAAARTGAELRAGAVIAWLTKSRDKNRWHGPGEEGLCSADVADLSSFQEPFISAMSVMYAVSPAPPPSAAGAARSPDRK